MRECAVQTRSHVLLREGGWGMGEKVREIETVLEHIKIMEVSNCRNILRS